MAEPIATVNQGRIKGILDQDVDGNNYYKFLGIPYAKPPVGQLRFKAPQPADPWNSIRDGTLEGNPCVSLDMLTSQNLNEPIGSEDCLYLNVFTRELPSPNVSLKPVMVFIHGGAFTLGSGSEKIHGARFLLTQDVVLVTINYRLGIFGFLSTDDPTLEVPGNAGLKDQTFALKWVQNNIRAFNGDPFNVTIFGVSAGGASVHFQVLSPTARGLFQKAIGQSGCALNPWAWGQQNAIEIAGFLGKKVSTEREALAVLMNASAKDLFKAAQQIPDSILDPSSRRPFGPVIEKPNPTAFLTENPSDLLASGRYNQVPFIQGFTSNEGLIYDFTSLIKLELKPENGILWNIGVEKGSEKEANIIERVKQFYFKNGMTKDAIHKFVSDTGFIVGIMETTKLSVKTSANPVYLYIFSAEVQLANLMKAFFGMSTENVGGVAHGSDQCFLFNSEMLQAIEIDEESMKVMRQVVKIWTDFAKTGRPHDLWDPISDEDEIKYFDIDKQLSLKVNPCKERLEFWDVILREAHINANFSTKAKL